MNNSEFDSDDATDVPYQDPSWNPQEGIVGMIVFLIGLIGTPLLIGHVAPDWLPDQIRPLIIEHRTEIDVVKIPEVVAIYDRRKLALVPCDKNPDGVWSAFGVTNMRIIARLHAMKDERYYCLIEPSTE